MNPSIQIPSAGSSPRRTSLKTATAILLALGMTGTAPATDQPPPEPEQQRAWLVGHLVTDMQTTGAFRSDEIVATVGLVNALTDDQTRLLARFYYLTRAKVEEDARLYAMQQTDTEETLAEAKAEVADLLARLQRQIWRAYRELAAMNPGCQTLCHIAYASIPGWCECHDYAIPDWYFGDGCYVGPVLSARYAGAYSVRAYGAYHDRGSRYNYWNSRASFHDNIGQFANGRTGSTTPMRQRRTSTHIPRPSTARCPRSCTAARRLRRSTAGTPRPTMLPRRPPSTVAHRQR